MTVDNSAIARDLVQTSAHRKAEQVIGSYNPNELDDVKRIKSLAKDMIRTIYSLKNADNRRKAIAYTHIEEAAMMAVKSIFSED